MENFVVSARKYRPQTFDTVVGQEHITTTLKNAIINNQLAHAFLFCGPRGVGKTTCARILAKTINCENRSPEGEACNQCTSCLNFEKGTSFNIHELDAASNNSVDDIRVLVEQVRFAPQAGAYKVYIIDEVHMLSQSAFNAFLKTLEEPPPFAIFILATTEKHKILPTILSRCQIFDFKRITNEDTTRHLQDICKKENIKAERNALHLIAQKSEGCMRDSLSIMDKIVSFTDGKITYANTLEHLNILDEDYYFKMLELNHQQDASGALLLFNEIIEKGFEPDVFVEGYQEFLRNLMVSIDARAAVLLQVSEDFKPRYAEQSKKISAGWLISGLNILTEAAMGIKQARNRKLFMELALIKLCYLGQAIEVAEGGGIKKKSPEQQKPLNFRRLKAIPLQEKANIPNKKLQELPTPLSLANEPEPVLLVEKKTDPIKPLEEKVDADGLPTFSSLHKIRQKINAALEHKAQEEKVVFNIEQLQAFWTGYANELRSKNLPTAASAFETATLTLLNDDEFMIKVMNTVQQKFIEGERAGLSLGLHEKFQGKIIKFVFETDEAEQEPLQQEQQVPTRLQLEKMVEQNPLLRELMVKLNMGLG